MVYLIVTNDKLGKDLTKNQICMLVTNKLLGLKITN